MANPAHDQKFDADDLDRLAVEVGDSRRAAVLAEAATALRGLSDDDDRDSV